MRLIILHLTASGGPFPSRQKGHNLIHMDTHRLGRTITSLRRFATTRIFTASLILKFSASSSRRKVIFYTAVGRRGQNRTQTSLFTARVAPRERDRVPRARDWQLHGGYARTYSSLGGR